MNLKPRVIEDASSVWKWGSARLVALMSTAELAYSYIQADPALAGYVQEIMSPTSFHRSMAFLGLLTLLSKIVRFDGTRQP